MCIFWSILKQLKFMFAHPRYRNSEQCSLRRIFQEKICRTRNISVYIYRMCLFWSLFSYANNKCNSIEWVLICWKMHWIMHTEWESFAWWPSPNEVHAFDTTSYQANALYWLCAWELSDGWNIIFQGIFRDVSPI